MTCYIWFILLYLCYSGINTSEVAQQVSGGECDGLRVPTVFLTRLLGNGRQAQQGLDTDVTLPTTWLNALQMAAPSAAIWTHLVTGVGACVGTAHACPT